MVGTDQRVEIDRAQLDLLARRLAQPHPTRRSLARRRHLSRQVLEQPVLRHRQTLASAPYPTASESAPADSRKKIAPDRTKIHKLSG